jgi:hypothetical protein
MLLAIKCINSLNDETLILICDQLFSCVDICYGCPFSSDFLLAVICGFCGILPAQILNGWVDM